MTAEFRKIARGVLCLLVAALFPTIVQPYVLQGPHIIQLMTEKLGQARSLSVSQRLIFYHIQPQPRPPSGAEYAGEPTTSASPPERLPAAAHETEAPWTDNPGNNDSPDNFSASENLPADRSPLIDQTPSSPTQLETIQLDESLKYIFSEAFRSDIVSDSNQRVYVFNQGQTITVIDGVISDTGESRFDVYKDLLLYRSRTALSERLSNLGIDISVSSLGRFDGRLALVVGAEFPDETVPQIWVDKETFHPLRIIVYDTKSPYSTQRNFLEIRYSKWQPIGKIKYPMRIEFIQDGATVRAIEVFDYQINPDFSKDVFDIARLKSEYRQAVTTPEGTLESEGLSEVQKTIEEFRKIFE